jgi:hypothetical protein
MREKKNPTIVYNNGHRAFSSDLRVEFFQCGPVVRKDTGKVPGRDDDSGICPRSRNFLAKCDCLPRTATTCTYNDREVLETRRIKCLASGLDDPGSLAMRKVQTFPHRAR